MKTRKIETVLLCALGFSIVYVAIFIAVIIRVCEV